MAKSIKQLEIKNEFKNLIRPLRRQEYMQLEENILKDGCREAIITWNNYIVDGHNRYEICTKHNIPFETLEMQFESDEEVIAWICANQLGRRNISEETRKFLIGMQYEAEKVINSRRNANGLNQYSDNEDDYVRELEKSEAQVKKNTTKRIAEENNVSTGTVQKYAIYTRALEAIGQKVPDIVPKILSGRYKISHKNIVELSKLSEKELMAINKQMNRRNNSMFKYSRARDVITSAATDDVKTNTPSVKDMPTFDPDAEVTELFLTVPTWISSISRTETNANLNIISQGAKTRLINTLTQLKEATNKMLTLLGEEQ